MNTRLWQAVRRLLRRRVFLLLVLVAVVLVWHSASTTRPAVAQVPIDEVGPVPTTLVWRVSLPVVMR